MCVQCLGFHDVRVRGLPAELRIRQYAASVKLLLQRGRNPSGQVYGFHGKEGLEDTESRSRRVDIAHIEHALDPKGGFHDGLRPSTYPYLDDIDRALRVWVNALRSSSVSDDVRADRRRHGGRHIFRKELPIGGHVPERMLPL